MLSLDLLNFAPIPITPEAWIEAARFYKGLPYSPGHVAVWDETNPEGPQGVCDCAGLPILAARRLGLLPEEFNVALPFHLWKISRAVLKFELLQRNFDPVDAQGARAGDLLFFKEGFTINATVEMLGAKHCALLTSRDPDALLHAINEPGSNEGSVREGEMGSWVWNKLTRHVWRLKNFSL